MYNRYQGNSGRVRRMEERQDFDHGPERQKKHSPVYEQPVRHAPPAQKPPGPLSGLSGELGRLLGKISLEKMETEDLILLLVLYLLYKESGDEEFLIMMAIMVFL